MKKDSLNVKLPMCDTLTFLRLSLVEGIHLAFVQRIWIICRKFYCMIMDKDEPLRMSTGYLFFGMKSATWLKARWHFFFSGWAVCTVVTELQKWFSTGECSIPKQGDAAREQAISPLLISCFALVCGFAVMWLMFAEGIGTKETQLRSIFGPSKSRAGGLRGQCWSASDPSEQQGVDEIITYNYK